MPCQVYEIEVNRTKENEAMLRVADNTTRELDRAREAILADKTPDLSYVYILRAFVKSLPRDDSPPYRGVLLDYALRNHLYQLLAEFDEYASESPAAWDKNKILARQIKHRREDITRLRIEFAKNDDGERLAKTLNVDYTKPLAPQLGFDPDDF
jgi:hypothetical protein